MPRDGVTLTPREDLLTFEEQKRTLALFADLGVTKLRFTGGEPTLSRDLINLVKFARELPSIETVGMTTNGFHLTQKVEALADAGLDSINISLDTLREHRFEELTLRKSNAINKVFAGIYAAKAAGIKNIKVNCVLMGGINDDEVIDFVAFGQKVGVNVRFIEFMPFSGNEWSSKRQLVPYRDVLSSLRKEGINLEALTPQDPHDTTKWFTAPPIVTQNSDDGNRTMIDFNCSGSGSGSDMHDSRVGFITSMSDTFCSGCNRLRITADGKLRVCLFGKDGFDLLESYRTGASDSDVADMISGALMGKHATLGGNTVDELGREQSDRPMIMIGG